MEDYLSIIEKSGFVRWNDQSMPLNVFVEQTSDAAGFRIEFVEILQQAWLEWSAVASKISFQFVSDPARAQVVCKWVDNKMGLLSTFGDTDIGAITLSSITPDGIRSAELRILTMPPANMHLVKISNNMMRRIALHEVGHALGITGHSDEPADIMSTYVVFEDRHCTLSKRDVNTLNALYALDKTAMDSARFDPSKINIAKSVEVAKLNREAMAAIESRDFYVAIAKLEEARKLDPKNEVIQQNLGVAYIGCGTKELMTFDFSMASFQFLRGVPLLGAKRKKP